MGNKLPLTRLLGPFSLGGLELKNRIVMPPMLTNYATREGYVTEQVKGFYEVRAQGGAGLVIVESTCVDAPIGKLSSRQIVIDDDRFTPGLSELAEVIRRHGARAAIQLHHAGRNGHSSFTGVQPVAPSPIARPGGELPRELGIGEIQNIVQRFAQAARRAREAGFDAVEIQAAHCHLICQFLSAAANHRRDRYGGGLANRARFLMEILAAVKQEVGPVFPVWCRLNGREYGIEGGITVAETQEVARMAEKAGSAAISISIYAPHGSDLRHLPPMAQPPGNLVRFAEAVKQVVRVPVITVGRIDPELGERILQEGKADLIGIGRGILADPELPKKAASGGFEDIRPCLVCGTCLAMAHEDCGVKCRVNPTVGREREYALRPASQRKKVVVVGGGPAGMEAARVAALRGHEVSLFEKSPQLGGQIIAAAAAPYKENIENLRSYFAGQLRKLGVRIEVGMEATPQIIQNLRPDAVILAMGVKPLIPEIPELETLKAVQAEDVLTGRAEVGEEVIIIGGELVGCETAEFLAEKGKRVTVTRRGSRMATKAIPSIGETLVNRLAYKGVRLLTGITYERVTERGLLIVTSEGERLTLEADTIVLAAGSRPHTGLLASLEGRGMEVYLAGDCVEPRSIMEALEDGYRIAVSL